MRAAAIACLVACGSQPRPPVTNTAPPYTEQVGTAAPIHLIEMSRDGSWVAICQARSETDGKPGLLVDTEDGPNTFDDHVIGDAYRPYLVWGSGSGEPYDVFLTTSYDHRWLAMAKRGVVYVIDGHTRASFPLANARLVDDDTNDGLGREIAIGRDHVAFVRGTDVVIRELHSVRERVIPIPYGRIWSVEVDDGGRWAKIGVVENDTDGDGALEGPFTTTTAFERTWRCLPGATKNRPRDDGDRVEVTWIDMVEGTTVHDRKAISPVGDRMLYRGDDHALVLGGRTLAKDCRWGVTAISHDPPRVFTGCGFGPTYNDSKAPLQILGGQTARVTGLEFEAQFASIHFSAPSESEPRVVTGYLCSGHRCLEVATGHERQVPGRVVFQFEHYAAYELRPRGEDDWRDATWSVIDLATGETRELPNTHQQAVQLQDRELPILEVSESIGGDAPITPYDMRTARPVKLEAGMRILGHDLLHRRYLIGPQDAYLGFPQGPLQWLEMR